MESLGKALVKFGIILIGAGLLIVLSHKIPLLGKLPGDMLIQKKNYTFYFPLATSILVSMVISLVFWFFSRR
jgi:hypothetical protein